MRIAARRSLTDAITIGISLLLAGCASQTIKFPGEPVPNSLYHSLYKPEGNGPFPAVVLLHTCGGIQPHIFDWARRLKEWGYVALVVDSFTPRGEKIVCGTWRVSVGEVAGDAFAALDHLRARSFVDRDRIGVMGFSYGAMAALRLASDGYQKSRHPGAPGFQAAVALYPYCTGSLLSPNLPADVLERVNNLRDDIVTPLLILIGDADDETPAPQCAIKAEQLRQAGRPVSIKVYPGTTHAFDSANLGSSPWRNPRGYVYRYNPDATADAAKMSRDFFARSLK